MTRLVNPAPGALVRVPTVLAAKSRSLALVVVTAAVLLLALLPVPVAVTSTGAVTSAPLYSRMRISGKAAGPLKVTVTVLPPAGAAAMFLA